MQGFRYWGSRDLVSDLYLLWMGSLRLGEVEELRLEDLDTLASLSAGLAGRRLTIRHSKGLRDRTVYLTDTAVRVLEAYLAARGQGPTDHLFLYRNQALNKDLIPARIKAAGKRVGVRVYPHKLRHTHATQILNAGCQVTTIQKILGHQRLNSTMIYTRVHDRTVAEDYYAAMDIVEKRLEVAPGPPWYPGDSRTQIARWRRYGRRLGRRGGRCGGVGRRLCRLRRGRDTVVPETSPLTKAGTS